jgi:ATP-dependent protease HslVU (ClpYQ) peptidase subunit
VNVPVVPLIVVPLIAAGVVAPIGPGAASAVVSNLVLTAVEIALNSLSISVPLTIFEGFPVSKASLLAKLVAFV